MTDRQHPRMYEDHVWRYVCFQCGHTVFSERTRRATGPSPDEREPPTGVTTYPDVPDARTLAERDRWARSKRKVRAA